MLVGFLKRSVPVPNFFRIVRDVARAHIWDSSEGVYLWAWRLRTFLLAYAYQLFGESREVLDLHAFGTRSDLSNGYARRIGPAGLFVGMWVGERSQLHGSAGAYVKTGR